MAQRALAILLPAVAFYAVQSMPLAATEAQLVLCTAPFSASRHHVDLEDGRMLGIVASGTPIPPDCEVRALDLGFEAISGLATGKGSPSGRIGRVSLIGSDRSHLSKVVVDRAGETSASRLPALPAGADLLSRVIARPFGSEERVTAQRNGSAIAIECRAGEKPAGIALDPGAMRMPQGIAAELVATGVGEAGFRFSVVPRGADATAAGEFEIDGTKATVAVQADAWPAAEGAVEFVVTCPRVASRFVLETVLVAPQATARETGRSAWMWNASRWASEPGTLLDEAASHSLDTIFVALDITAGEVENSEALSNFVREASTRGIAVVAVEGDPEMVLPSGRLNALERARAIADYQRGSASGRLKGVQYDIEPYLLNAFEERPEELMTEWRRTVSDLAAVLDQKIDLVLPFWIADRPDARKTLLDGLDRSIVRITVMSYRTTPQAVMSISEPLLAWGGEHQIPVAIGFEAGFVADEVQRHYVPAMEGDLRLLQVSDVLAAVVVDRVRPGPKGITFRLQRESSIPGSLISFQGNKEAMMDLARETKPVLEAWRSFAGFAFHGLFDR